MNVLVRQMIGLRPSFARDCRKQIDELYAEYGRDPNDYALAELAWVRRRLAAWLKETYGTQVMADWDALARLLTETPWDTV